MSRTALLLALVTLLLPPAVADDPFRPQICDQLLGCIGPNFCVQGVTCVPSPCEGTAECDVTATGVDECGYDPVTTGETCQTGVAAEVGVDRAAYAPLVGDLRANRVRVFATLTEGNMTTHHLPNAWLSYAAGASGTVAGVSLGETTLGVYRSAIELDDEATGLQGTLFPGSARTFSELGVSAAHEGSPAGARSAQVALLFLDLAPEGCHAVTSVPGAAVYCPRAPALA